MSTTAQHRKSTKGIKVTTYVEMRDRLIDEIINNVKTVYPNDNEMLSGVTDLTIQLKVAKPDIFFVQDLWGFCLWSSMTNQKPSSVLTTCIHDLSEFARNRHQNWFCPRTTGYRKYLTGASK